MARYTPEQNRAYQQKWYLANREVCGYFQDVFRMVFLGTDSGRNSEV